MSPTPLPSGAVRPAAAVNEDIRALWSRAGAQLTAEEREAYDRLLEEWATAMRAEAVEAA